MDLVTTWPRVRAELEATTDPAGLSDDALIYEFVAGRRSSDAQPDDMDDAAIAWARGVEATIRGRGLYEYAMALVDDAAPAAQAPIEPVMIPLEAVDLASNRSALCHANQFIVARIGIFGLSDMALVHPLDPSIDMLAALQDAGDAINAFYSDGDYNDPRPRPGDDADLDLIACELRMAIDDEVEYQARAEDEESYYNALWHAYERSFESPRW